MSNEIEGCKQCARKLPATFCDHCGYLFCGMHIPPELHACETYAAKKAHVAELRGDCSCTMIKTHYDAGWAGPTAELPHHPDCPLADLSNVTPIRTPPPAGSFLDEAAKAAGYGSTHEWAGTVLNTAANRVLNGDPAIAATSTVERARVWEERCLRLRESFTVLLTTSLQVKFPNETPAALTKKALAMVLQLEEGVQMQVAPPEKKVLIPTREDLRGFNKGKDPR